VLATPSFAAWLESDSDFIPNALQQIVGTVDPVEVDVICACIDSLSPQPDLMHHPSGEGFSIHHVSHNKLGDLWEERAAKMSPDMKSTLTFTAIEASKVAVTLPLANTLFKNQRLSTLLVSRWRSSGGSFAISRQQIQKDNVNIHVFGNAGRLWRGSPRTHIPMTLLTPIRRIESGLGNIVRRIEFGNGDVGPASRELETSVTEYLMQQNHERSTIDVWALVIPRDTFSGAENESKEVSMATVNDIRATWSSSVTPDRRYVGNWIGKGATLCRVRECFKYLLSI
jgi:hypothetical protein